MSRIYQIELVGDDERGKKTNRYQEIFDISEDGAKNKAMENISRIFGDSNIHIKSVNVAGKPKIKKDKKKDNRDADDYYERKYNEN